MTLNEGTKEAESAFSGLKLDAGPVENSIFFFTSNSRNHHDCIAFKKMENWQLWKIFCYSFLFNLFFFLQNITNVSSIAQRTACWRHSSSASRALLQGFPSSPLRNGSVLCISQGRQFLSQKLGMSQFTPLPPRLDKNFILEFPCCHSLLLRPLSRQLGTIQRRSTFGERRKHKSLGNVNNQK